MALIVEEGTGLPDAESLCSVANATAYHGARGNAAWAALASDTVREQYLRKATDYMEQVYGERWNGFRVTTTQALSWPRDMVPIKDFVSIGRAYYANDMVPSGVVTACAELAMKAADGDLAPDLKRTTKSETVGEISVTYADGAPTYKRFRAVDNIVAKYLSGSGNTISLVRA